MLLRPANGEAQFEMVAETMRRTSLGSVKPGDRVNIETDVLSKYVAKSMPPGAERN